MNPREDRWFVRFRGHTLGPLTTEQVKTSLRNRELSDGDKVASTTNPGWTAIGTHPAFGAFTQTLRAPAVTLAPIPPPQEIWQRKARNRAAEIATFTPEEPGAIPGINARGLGGSSSAPLYRNFSSDGAAPAARATAYQAYPADPNARVIHPAAATAAPPTSADGKKKRVAAPGKKLGRPRKNPLPAAAAPENKPLNKYDLSVVDLVAPILEAAPASVAAPIFDVAPKPAPSPQAPRPATEPYAGPPSAPAAAPASPTGSAALPSRPAFAAATDTHVPPPAVPVTLGAAIAAFEAEEEPRRELSAEEKLEAAAWEASPEATSVIADAPQNTAIETPANMPAPPFARDPIEIEPPAVLEESTAETVEASLVPPQTFAMAAEVAAIPEPRREEIPAPSESNPAAEAEEVPAPPAPKVEAQPATEKGAERAAASFGEERLAVESLALLESLRDWRRKEEELAQEIRRGPVTPRERPVIPVRESAPAEAVATAALPGRASPRAGAIAALLAHKYFLLTAALVAVAVAAAVYVAVNKTRGPENRSFPDPSGPTQPASKEDPTPSLRAPTRPQRD